MFEDYYLKFSSKAEADLYLLEYGGDRFKFQNTDVLGVLYEVLDELAPEQAPKPLEGWHVNIRALPGEDTQGLINFKVNPEPKVWRRVWA